VEAGTLGDCQRILQNCRRIYLLISDVPDKGDFDCSSRRSNPLVKKAVAMASAPSDFASGRNKASVLLV